MRKDSSRCLLAIFAFSISLFTLKYAHAGVDDDVGFLGHPAGAVAIDFNVPYKSFFDHPGQTSYRYSLGGHMVGEFDFEHNHSNDEPRYIECFLNMSVPYTKSFNLDSFRITVGVASIASKIVNTTDGTTTRYTFKGDYYDGYDLNNRYGLKVTCDVSACSQVSVMDVTKTVCNSSAGITFDEFHRYIFDTHQGITFSK